MNFRFFGGIALIFLGLTVSFCTYTPDEDFFKEIEPVDPEVFSISLATYNHMDTIYLEGPASFNYDLGTGNGSIQEARILVDDSEVQRIHSHADSFNYSPRSTGIYHLRIEFVSSSGSGSLADRSGAEMVQVWREWIINAYIETAPAKPEVTTSIVNGYSVITWTPYTRTKFVRYRIRLENGLTRDFTDPNQTSWVDSTYTGNFRRYYSVSTENAVGTATSQVSLAGSSIAVQASFQLTDSTVDVHFPKPVYYGAFDSYSIIQVGSELARLSNPEQTVYTFKTTEVGLNNETALTVTFNPKAPATHSASGYALVKTSPTTPRLSRTIDSFAYNQELNSIVGYNDGKIFLIDPVTMIITDSIAINGRVSFVPYKGPFLYYAAYYSPTSNQVRQLNMTTRVEKNVTNGGANVYGPYGFTASESQIVTFSYRVQLPGQSSTYTSRVQDFTTNTQVAAESSPTQFSTHVVSDDGKFFRVFGNRIYAISGGSASLIGTLAFKGSWGGFRKDLCTEIISYSANTVYIYDSNTLAQKRSISAPSDAYYYGYDVASKGLFFYNGSIRKFYSIHIDSGVQKEVKALLTDIEFINGTIILNGRDYYRLP